MEYKKILIIEDEEAIADVLSYKLMKESFLTQTAGTGREGIEKLESFKPDLIILDIMLPDISGFDICKSIASSMSVPIVMLTAMSDTMDKIIGIELGADDYITKPFEIQEVIVRIKAIFRRIELSIKDKKEPDNNILKLARNIHIDIMAREVKKDEQKIEFTNKEYELLLFLAKNPKQVFSRAELMDKIWSWEYEGDTRTVDLHVQRIRKKLDENKNNSIIETVFGYGYKLNDYQD